MTPAALPGRPGRMGQEQPTNEERKEARMMHDLIPRALRGTVAAATAGVLSLVATACATGPTSRQEVCDRYDSLGDRIGIGSVIGDPVFWAAGDLADVAGRYEGRRTSRPTPNGSTTSRTPTRPLFWTS